ncbi:MAG TPA: HAD-IB family phosphatase [Candidatus Acidoferrum sp.]|nr:HAD-IB family phosphatase [Candidatus Acidoferrum sp.]
MSDLILLSDFDGTIVDVDTGSAALAKFADGDWETIEKQSALEQITFEESLKRQFSMIAAPELTIVEEVDAVAVVRPHFAEMVNYCRHAQVPFIITSGGLDFIIRHFMSKKRVDDYVRVYAPKAECRPEGIRLYFPKLHDPASYSFKDDLVAHYQRGGHRVAYIGDGHADYYALRKADFAFAMKGSPSAQRCRKDEVKFEEIVDFQAVLDVLPKIVQR